MFYLRSACLMASSLIHKASPSGGTTSQLKLHVWPNECDLKFVNNSTYLQFFELGRIDLMLKANFFWTAVRESLFVPIRRLHVDFRRPLKRFQSFTVSTRILAWDDQNIFLIQGIHSDSKPIALAFMNSIVKKGRETINPVDLMTRLKINNLAESEELKSFSQNFHGSQKEFERINQFLDI